MIKNILISVFIFVLFVCFSSFMGHNSSTQVNLNFTNYVGNQVLKLDSTTYQNNLQQSFTITNFKYYISNICLVNQNLKEFKFQDSYLIREDDEHSKNIFIKNIPSGKYSTLSFILGVDSLHNCSGAQSGALDVINGMFWPWNTGYVFLKLEGKTSASSQPGNVFEFHIGGYKTPANCIRKIELSLNNLLISSEKNNLIKINTNILEILKNPESIDFTKHSSIINFHNAEMMADNYKDMFSLSH